MKKILKISLPLMLFAFILLGSVSLATDADLFDANVNGTTDVTGTTNITATDRTLRDTRTTGLETTDIAANDAATTDIATTNVTTTASTMSLIISFIVGAIFGGFGVMALGRKDYDNVKIESR